MQRFEEIDVALVATPWWLIPSKNIVTATEHLIEDYAFNINECGYRNIIFSRKRDHTDEKGVEDVSGYGNKYVYTRVSTLDRKLFNKANTLFFYIFYILKVSFKIKNLGIKRIIVFQTFSFCYWLKALNPNAKIIFYTVNHELSKENNYLGYGSIPDRLATVILPKIHCVIAMSEYIKNGILERFPEVKNKCKVVYPGIDTNIFKEKIKEAAETIIIYSGRIVPEKGVHILAKAFCELKKDFKDVKLYILGGGDRSQYSSRLF